MEQLLTLREVAHILNIQLRTIREHARKGVLPCIKIGSLWRVSKEQLEKYIADNTTK